MIIGTGAAYAKVNLALDILGTRPDGYHDMRMIMQSISLCDTVTVEAAERGFSLCMEGFIPPQGKKTLEERAVDAFFEAVGQIPPGVQVTLDKKTPAYAGLGGGSADVAALLRILRDYYAPELSTETLEKIGLTVGSDMPFCVRGGTALAEGRGEILTDLTPLPPCTFVLCKPEFGIPTPTLFALVDNQSLVHRPDIEGMMSALAAQDLRGVASRLRNVFEDVLPRDYAEVFRIKQKLLDSGALNAAMSGSGPTVFGIFEDSKCAKAAAQMLKQQYPETYLARPVRKF